MAMQLSQTMDWYTVLVEKLMISEFLSLFMTINNIIFLALNR